MRRNYRSSGTCNAVAESDEHNQSDVQSAVGPEDPRRGSERPGEETCRCTQGVLWEKCIINALYILHHGKTLAMLRSFHNVPIEFIALRPDLTLSHRVA